MVQNPAEDDHKNGVEVRDIESDIKGSMGSGKKHFLCNDYPAAITCFQDACSLLSEKYGQMAPECSDAYYYYGVSLLELARMENGVLGNALKGVPDEDESDKDVEEVEQFEKPNLQEKERLELRESVEAAMATEDEEDESEEEREEKNSVSKDSKLKDDDVEMTKKDDAAATSVEESDKKEDEKDDVTKQDKKDMMPEQSDSNMADAKTSDSPEDSGKPCSSKSESKEGQATEEEIDPDDIPNMQLAWEMLELAKILYQKKEKCDNTTLMVAQCHLKLGELGLELENYTQAIDDFLECLGLQKEILPDTDRKLAETHYNLGLSYTFAKRYDDAIEHYKTSLEVLEGRVNVLEGVIEEKDSNGDKDESMRECKEVGEIKELIPDIYSKIEDVIGLKGENRPTRSFSPSVQSGETTIGFGGDAQSSSACSTIPVKKTSPSSSSGDTTCDITHLVRRKRASPDDTVTPDNGSGDCKKMKQETDSEDVSMKPKTEKSVDGDSLTKPSENDSKPAVEGARMESENDVVPDEKAVST